MSPETSTALLARALERLEVAVLVTDAERRVVHANPAALRVTGYELSALVGRDLGVLYGPDTDPEVARAGQEDLARGEAVHLGVVLHRQDGHPLRTYLQVSPVHDLDGRLTHFVAALQDLAPLEEAEARLERAAGDDPLTGLENRLAFDLALRVEHRRATRHGLEFSVLLADLDGFSQINERHGRPAGDETLRAVAKALLAGRRFSDYVYRLEGDAFAMILPHTNADGVVAVVGRTATTISRLTARGKRLSASVGAATFPSDATDLGELVRLAHERMLARKSDKP